MIIATPKLAKGAEAAEIKSLKAQHAAFDAYAVALKSDAADLTPHLDRLEQWPRFKKTVEQARELVAARKEVAAAKTEIAAVNAQVAAVHGANDALARDEDPTPFLNVLSRWPTNAQFVSQVRELHGLKVKLAEVRQYDMRKIGVPRI